MSINTQITGVEYKEENMMEDNMMEDNTPPNNAYLQEKEKKNSKKHVSFELNTQDKIPFWGENPNILFQSNYILEFFPTEEMGMNQKLNAITRLIILFSLIGFIYSKNIRILIISIIILFCIYLLYLYNNRNKTALKEHYENPAERLYTLTNDKFEKPSLTNPFSNVLITDYEDNPNKKPAPPIEDIETNKQIMESAKQMIIKSNSGQPNINEKLFSDLGDNFNFEQSMRPFFSTANTEIPNDQQAFAEFCYGGMISCKEGNKFACARNLPRYANY